jgi:hypothetical protein
LYAGPGYVYVLVELVTDNSTKVKMLVEVVCAIVIYVNKLLELVTPIVTAVKKLVEVVNPRVILVNTLVVVTKFCEKTGCTAKFAIVIIDASVRQRATILRECPNSSLRNHISCKLRDFFAHPSSNQEPKKTKLTEYSPTEGVN